MKNGLLKKLGKGVILPAIFMGVLGSGCCESNTKNYDGKKQIEKIIEEEPLTSWEKKWEKYLDMPDHIVSSYTHGDPRWRYPNGKYIICGAKVELTHNIWLSDFDREHLTLKVHSEEGLFIYDKDCFIYDEESHPEAFFTDHWTRIVIKPKGEKRLVTPTTLYGRSIPASSINDLSRRGEAYINVILDLAGEYHR